MCPHGYHHNGFIETISLTVIVGYYPVDWSINKLSTGSESAHEQVIFIPAKSVQVSEALFLYCRPECPNCRVNAFQVGQTTYAFHSYVCKQ